MSIASGRARPAVPFISSIVSIALVAGVAIAVPLAAPAGAWKPPTHLFGVEAALQDAIDGDGMVTIDSVDGQPPITVPVNATILSALQAHPEAYRAGTIGPDAFPDLLFGQGQIHPDTCTHNDEIQPNPSPCPAHKAQTFQWFQFLWEQAFNPATPSDERLKDIAFALGYMGGHGAGDIWGHTWVNSYAEGVFPDFTDLARSDISVRHIVVEGYSDKHRPGFDATDSGTHQYALDAPTDFIGDTLILSNFSRDHSDYPFFNFFFDMRDGLRNADDGIEDDLTSQDLIGDCPLCVPDPTDCPVNLVECAFLLLADQYLDAWVDDITDGLRAWPEVWAAVAEQFNGKKPEFGPIGDALKEWVLLHFLSMMGLPDIVGEGIFLVSEIVDFVVGLITSVLDAIFDFIKSIPIIGDVVTAIQDLYDKAKSFILTKVQEIADELAGLFITFALGFSNLNPTTKAAVDQDGDGRIEPSEVIHVFAEPEEFISNPDLFPDDPRATIDADMHLPAGCVDQDDDPESFCDYDPNLFAPLKDTTTLAKLAMLDQTGLNTYFEAKAGGNVAALGDLYGPHANASGAWTVPNNVMLGWAKSIDAEYQFRTSSPNDGHSYGTGQMRLWEDCVSRARVFRNLFAQPVQGIEAFADAGDPPTGLSDSTPPVTTLALTGPNFTSGSTTFVSGSTVFTLTSTDDYWSKPELRVKVITTPSGTTPAALEAGVPADPAPFSMTGADGAKLMLFQAIDGNGICNTESPNLRLFSLDNTPPVITVLSPVPPLTQYTSDFILPLNFTATDGAGVGVDESTKRHFADGVEQTPVPTTIDLFDYPAGTHLYRAEEKDLLGNLGSTTVPWQTIVTHTSLANNLDKAFFVRGCITTVNTYRPLKVKLNLAADADARGNDGASDNQLQSFIDNVAGQVSKTITPYCANILTVNAMALQAA